MKPIITRLDDFKKACQVYDKTYQAYVKALTSAEGMVSKDILVEYKTAILERVREAQQQLGQTHSMVRHHNTEVLAYFASWRTLTTSAWEFV